MIVGINNIFTILWFLIISGCCLVFTYVALAQNFFASDLIVLIKITMSILLIITIGLTIFFLIKFRFLAVKCNKLISFHPLTFKRKIVNLDQVRQITWNSWELKSIVFRTVKIMDKQGSNIHLSDFEFENFDRLIRKIPNIELNGKKEVIDFKQARANSSFMCFTIVINLILISFVAWIDVIDSAYQLVYHILYTAIILLLYAAQKRRRKYMKMLKGRTQQCIFK